MGSTVSGKGQAPTTPPPYGVGGHQGQPVGGLGSTTHSLEHRIRLWMNKLTAQQSVRFTPEGTLLKMKEEWEEFLTDPDDESELADLIITAIAHAHTRGWRIGIAVAEKMTINEARTWELQEDGTIHHV